jgi:hypothetical protein
MGARHHGAAPHAPGLVAAAPPRCCARDSTVPPRRRTAHQGCGDGSWPLRPCARTADATAPRTRSRAPAAAAPLALTSWSRPSPRLVTDPTPETSDPYSPDRIRASPTHRCHREAPPSGDLDDRARLNRGGMCPPRHCCPCQPVGLPVVSSGDGVGEGGRREGVGGGGGRSL